MFDFLPTNSLSRDRLTYERGGVKNIHYGDIHTRFKSGFRIEEEVVPYIKDSDDFLEIRKESYCLEGDVVIADASEDYTDIGKSVEILHLGEQKIVAGLHTMLLRKKKYDDFSIGFPGYLVKTNTVRKQMMKMATGISVLGLSKRNVEKIRLIFPSLPEQKKIAEFLGSVDAWIETLRAQKGALESYKKGVMQKIFSREIRFKDENGNDFPEWEEKELKKILKERKEFSVKGNGYPHISLTVQGVVPKSKRYNRDFLVGDDDKKGYKVTRLNDLCYNPANLKFGVISINELGEGIFSPIYATFKIIDQNIGFIGYYLVRNEFINKARKYEQGTVYERMAVHPSDFLKVKIPIPSYLEQQKIAEFLSGIDEKISSLSAKLASAQKFKKGLLQKMFV